MNEGRQKALGWAVSVAIHAVVFCVAAGMGLFVSSSPDPVSITDVSLYEVAAAEPAGMTGGDDGGAEVAGFSVPEDVPAISEAYTKEPQRQQAYKEKHQQESGKQGSGKGMSTGSSAGSEGGHGDGQGNGDGAGAGKGNSAGRGSGDGTGDEAAQKPASPPRLLSGAVPAYPEDLRRQGIEGAVRVRLVVDREGTVEAAEIAATSGYGTMDSAAVEAVYRYRFSPALNAYQQPVRCVVVQTVRFQLN